jgi:hypothetical protein
MTRLQVIDGEKDVRSGAELEQAVLQEVYDVLREATQRLPTHSSWWLPFFKATRALQDELGDPDGEG